MVTWLGVGVVHRVAVQLEELHRLRLLLSVAAHGKCVLTDLQPIRGEEGRGNMDVSRLDTRDRWCIFSWCSSAERREVWVTGFKCGLEQKLLSIKTHKDFRPKQWITVRPRPLSPKGQPQQNDRENQTQLPRCPSGRDGRRHIFQIGYDNWYFWARYCVILIWTSTHFIV